MEWRMGLFVRLFCCLCRLRRFCEGILWRHVQLAGHRTSQKIARMNDGDGVRGVMLCWWHHYLSVNNVKQMAFIYCRFIYSTFIDVPFSYDLVSIVTICIHHNMHVVSLSTMTWIYDGVLSIMTACTVTINTFNCCSSINCDFHLLYFVIYNPFLFTIPFYLLWCFSHYDYIYCDFSVTLIHYALYLQRLYL